MKTTDVTARLAGLGGAKWEVHLKARAMAKEGADLIEMTIGEPDVPVPQEMLDVAAKSMMAGRTGYSDGQGKWFCAVRCLRTIRAEQVGASTLIR